MFTIKKNVKIHFVGIGGIGMSGIAEVLISLGYKVSGSDLSDSLIVEKLIKMGAEINIGHDAKNTKGATVVVYSSAIDKNNPEIKAALAGNIPLMRRAEMLAELMRLKHGLAVAGTHGKTTTTSFLATILHESEIDPTYIIGGAVQNLGGHAKVGKGNILVAEADESDGSFLLLNPIMSVITNIDHDHMDYYENEGNLVDSFIEFANKVPFYGLCALNIHDEKFKIIKKKMKRPWVTYGIAQKGKKQLADFHAKNVQYLKSGATYDLHYKGENVCKISISLPGKHNVLNSLAAIVIAYNMGISFEKIASSITKFEGIKRRFQILHSDDFVEIIDDYAHHPTEIAAILQSVKETRGDTNIVVVFEPHRFSRTKDCWERFFHCFNHADKLFLTPIYPASEKPIDGIVSQRLVNDINLLHPSFAHLIESTDKIGEAILNEIKFQTKEKITVVVLGAGAIGRKVREWLESSNWN